MARPCIIARTITSSNRALSEFLRKMARDSSRLQGEFRSSSDRQSGIFADRSRKTGPSLLQRRGRLRAIDPLRGRRSLPDGGADIGRQEKQRPAGFFETRPFRRRSGRHGAGDREGRGRWRGGHKLSRPGLSLRRRIEAVAHGSGGRLRQGQRPAIKMLALSMVREYTRHDLPVIGVGGIASAGDVVDFLSAGADAVQLLSGALIKGKDIYARIISSLPKALESRGFNSVVEAVSSVRQPAQSFEVRNPVIDHDRCTRCGLCVSVCPYFALSLDERVEIDGEACFGCGLCQSRCPVGAIGGVLI